MILLPAINQSPLTLDVRAAPLERALPEIGRAYGVPMRAAPALAHEIAVFSLRSASLEDLKSRIASTFSAEWIVASDGTLVLNRSTRLRAAEERAFVAQRRNAVKELVSDLRERIRTAPPITLALLLRMQALHESDQKTGKTSPELEVRLMSPDQRLFAEMVSAFAPDSFTALSGRTVYSSSPTAMQRPFPVSLAPAIARLEAERQALAAYERAHPEHASVTPDGPTGPIRTVLLAVSSERGGLTLELQGFDAAGRLALSESDEIDLFDRYERESAPPAPDSLLTQEHAFEPSPETKAYIAAMGNGVYFSDSRFPVNLAAARTYLDAVQHEPLSYAYTDLVLQAGRILNRSVVARASDEDLLAGMFLATSERIPLIEALEGKILDLSAPGWLALRPKQPFATALGFFPRADLRTALQAAHGDPTMSLATGIRIAESAPNLGIDPPMIALPMRLFHGRNYLNLDLMRIFAALGPEVRRRAEGGVRFGDLPLSARQALTGYVFGPRAGAIRMNEVRAGFANASSADGLESEPTIILPNGIPADARLTITRVASDAVMPIEDNLSLGRPMTMDTLASRIFPSRNPKIFPAGSLQQAARWSGTRLRRSGRELTTLRLDLTPRHHIQGTHTAIEAPSGPEFTASTLPKDLAAAFEEAMKLVALRYKDAPPYEAPPGETPPP